MARTGLPTLIVLGALALGAAPVQGTEVAAAASARVDEMDAMPTMKEAAVDKRPTARERRLARAVGREGSGRRNEALSALQLSEALGNRNDLELGPLSTDFPQNLVGGGLAF